MYLHIFSSLNFSPANYEQLMEEEAMLLFSVYDHDVLLSNDFGGEAFFPLKDVPGIINPKGKGSVGNFHGLKQVELALMLQENEGNFDFRGISKNTWIINSRWLFG